MADDLTPHVPILQPGSLMCVCGRRDNDASAHPFGLVAAATQEAGVEDHADDPAFGPALFAFSCTVETGDGRIGPFASVGELLDGLAVASSATGGAS